jgi:hypothetical protein
MSTTITLDMLRAASSKEFPVIDLGGSMPCRTGGKFPAAGNFPVFGRKWDQTFPRTMSNLLA